VSHKRLADGTIKTYYYPWKGGGAPLLQGEPGTPEFVASYNEAVKRKVTGPEGTILSLTQTYQKSSEFLIDLRERTQTDYKQKIKQIEERLGDFPLAALATPEAAHRARGIFKDWRNELALKSRRQADYAWQVLALILSWAVENGKIVHNPCVRGGRLYRSTRVEKIWTRDDEEAFLKSAPAHLHLPLLLALWTGQRQGDLLRLPWSAYDGTHIRLRQSKSIRKGGRPVRVVIPVGARLKVALDAAERKSPIILTNSLGRPWTSHGFQASFGTSARNAGIVGLTFHDLRGTAVTRLAEVECSVPEIATITGHSLRDVHSILDAHYLHRDPALAESAIRKLEAGTKLQRKA
jgi:integrase